MLICTHCQLSFTPVRTNNKNPQKFCSKTCSGLSKRNRVLHPCIVCNTETSNPKFCSRSCSATHNNSASPKRNKIFKICHTCGSEHNRTKYCSDECNPHKLCMTLEEKYYYTRAKKNEAWARYMSKKKNQTPEDADISAMQQFYLNCPIGYEVDHIIPISKGGLHTLSNLQYLTISENRKKSNKVLAS